jgi:uncharacterized protein YndB with AHSA1/START domain
VASVRGTAGIGNAMAVVHQHVSAPPARVFDALCDPRTYPEWLVGAKEIRGIDAGWPAPGSRFHHRVGLFGPLTVADTTKVLEIDEPRLLVLEVRARPLGRGSVRFELHETGEGTDLELDEQPIGALARLRALLDPMLVGRNTTSLHKLAALVEDDELERPEPSGDV